MKWCNEDLHHIFKQQSHIIWKNMETHIEVKPIIIPSLLYELSTEKTNKDKCLFTYIKHSASGRSAIYR